jgi:hypothetical protein
MTCGAMKKLRLPMLIPVLPRSEGKTGKVGGEQLSNMPIRSCARLLRRSNWAIQGYFNDHLRSVVSMCMDRNVKTGIGLANRCTSFCQDLRANDLVLERWQMERSRGNRKQMKVYRIETIG